MQLRPYQQEAKTAIQKEWQSGNKRTLLVLPTGTGKTIVFCKLTEDQVRQGEKTLILAHRGELLDQAADKMKKATGLAVAVEKAEETCLGKWERIVVGSVQTLMRQKRLDRFSKDHFDTIIVDEAHHCCPAGTLVDGVPIEKLAVGDYVSAFDHKSGCIVKRRVTATMVNPAPTIYELFLSDGSKLCCTGNHPVWNGSKYVPASSLKVENLLWRLQKDEGIQEIPEAKKMCNLRENVYTNIMELKDDTSMLIGMQRGCKRAQTQEGRSDMPSMREEVYHTRPEAPSSQIREDILLKGMQQQVQSGGKLPNDGKDKSEVCFGAYEEEQPDDERSYTPKDATVIEGTAIYKPDGERTVYKASDGIIQSTQCDSSRFFCIGTSYKNSRSKCSSSNSKLLQSGYRMPGISSSDRGRRKESLYPKREEGRCLENQCLEPVRVVRIEIHEPASRQRFNKLCPDDKVYNIEVENDNNYFANGILVHNCLADSYQRIFNHFNESKVLGVTATPDRGDMRNLGSFFESLAYEYTLPQAIKEGYLSPIKAQTIPIKLDLGAVKQQAGDFSTRDLGTALEPYLEQIATEMAAVCMDRKTVVFLPLIATSQKMRDILNTKGFRATEVNGTSKDRKEILADFESGRYNVLCNSMLLTEGWDCPAVDCIVMLRPTKIRSLYCQAVGRGTRLFPGKEYLLLLDFLWHSERHELCHPAHLICESEDVAKKMTENIEQAGCPVDIEEAVEQAESDAIAEREESLAKQLKQMRNRKRKLVDPLQFEMSIQAEDLANYIPAFGWQMAPPSEKQLKALEKKGIFPDEVGNAGKATLLLERLEKRKAEGLTTPKQIRLLEKRGFKNVGMWSFEAASKLINRISANGWRTPKSINPATYTIEKVQNNGQHTINTTHFKQLESIIS